METKSAAPKNNPPLDTKSAASDYKPPLDTKSATSKNNPPMKTRSATSKKNPTMENKPAASDKNPRMESMSAASEKNPPLESMSAASEDKTPTESKSATSKSDTTLESLSSEFETMMREESEPKVPEFHQIIIRVNHITPNGMYGGYKRITWSDGDLFKDIEQKIMDGNHIQPQARETTYFRIFTNAEFFNKPATWHNKHFPIGHIIVHGPHEFESLFKPGTLDENKTGFVPNAAGIFIQDKEAMWWLRKVKGKIRPPRRP